MAADRQIGFSKESYLDHLENILIGAEICAENKIRNRPSGSGILLPVSSLTSVLFGDFCVYELYMILLFLYLIRLAYISNGTTTQCRHAGHLYKCQCYKGSEPLIYTLLSLSYSITGKFTAAIFYLFFCSLFQFLYASAVKRVKSKHQGMRTLKQ